MGAITLQFTSNGDFGSRLIKWFDHGLYSHVDTVMPGGSLLGARSDVVMGVPKGVQIRPAEYVLDFETRRVVLPVSDDVEKKYYTFLLNQVGKEYNQRAILAFFFGAEWSNPANWFCSQLAIAGLIESGAIYKPSTPDSKIAPDDLLLICSVLVPL
jgi:hypothetical protein